MRIFAECTGTSLNYVAARLLGVTPDDEYCEARPLLL